MAEPDKAVIQYADQAGKKSTSTVFYTTGLTQAQQSEGLGALAVLLDSVTGAIITAIKNIIGVDVSALTDNLVGVLSDVEEVGEFIGLTGQNRKVLINIPGINSTFSVAGSDDLDVTDPDIAAFISMMEDGIAVSGGTVIPCDIAENDVVSVVTARERVRNSGARS